MTAQPSQIVKLYLDAWSSNLSRTDKLIDSLSDDDLMAEVSPGKNSGVYLLGHLVAVHDHMLPLMGLGDKLYPELEEIFIKNPDRSGLEKTNTTDLRNYWANINKRLWEEFNALATEEWFSRHTAVSEEDFVKEPHRNKLNILVSRTNHLAYHLGQLIFLKK